MNQTNRFHQRARRLSRVSEPRTKFASGADHTPRADDALLQAARAVATSRIATRQVGVAITLCCGVLLTSSATLTARAETAAPTAGAPLLTGATTTSRSRISHSDEKLAPRATPSKTPRASVPQRARRKTGDKMTIFLSPMTPRAIKVSHKVETAPVRVIRAARTTSTSQQMRIALNDGTSEQPRVLASGAAEAAPDLPKMIDGQPLRKIITVSALKQLPPASAPLPENLRANAISVDRFNGKSTDRLAQNPGAAPVRQPTKPVTNSDRLSNQIEVSVGTFVVLLTTSDLDTVAVAEPNTADVAVVNSRAVLVNGKTPGLTSLVVVDKFRIRQYQVRVVAAPGTLPRDISAQIGVPGIGVRQVRDAIVLDGEAANAEEARRAVEIAGIYSSKVINQMTVRDNSTAPDPMAAQIQNAIDLPNVRVRIVGETTILDGTVETAAQRLRAVTLASTMSKNVVNLLELPRLSLEQIQESLTTMGGETREGAAPSTINARMVGDQIMLEGSADDPALSQQAATLAARSGMEVINRIRVPQVTETERTFYRQVEDAIGIAGVRITGNSRLAVLQGIVGDTNDAVRAEHIARAYAGEVQNLLQVRNVIPVDVDVSIIEINTNDARNLGIQLGSVGLISETRTAATTQVLAPPAGSPPGTPNTIITNPGTISRAIDNTFREGNFLGGNGFIGLGPTGILDPVRVRLDALYSTGNARLLSNPRAVVNSGRRFAFQAGGQIPIPVASTVGSNGTTTGIEFKDFGVLVDVLPSANADGVVTMRIFTEVSQPDFANGVTPPGGGGPIPAFTRRATVTEITVPPGGTIALSGLIQNNVTKLVSRIPVLSQIPIIGSLFKSKRFQKNQSELVILVRPRVLPNPLSAGQTAPYTPAQGIDNQGTPAFGTGSRQDTGYSAGGLSPSARLNTGGVTIGGATGNNNAAR